MRRREFITLLGGVAVTWPLAASAQSKTPRIGFMGNSTAALEANLVDAFREGLRELGYEEGRNIVIEYRWANGKYDHFPVLVAELIAAKVEHCHCRHSRCARGKECDDNCAARHGGGRRPDRHGSCAEPGATWRQSHWTKLSRTRSRGQTAPASARSHACAFACRHVYKFA